MDRALFLRPDHANALNNRGNALLALGRNEQALGSYERALELNSNLADAHNNRGNALRALGRYTEAVESFERALKLKPGYSEGLNNLAITLMEMDHAADALTVYQAALRIDPNYLKAICNYAAALIALKRPQEALDHAERALTIDPGYYTAHLTRGNALVMLNRDAEALESYDAAAALRPTAWLPHNNKGLTLIQAGRIREGAALLERAIELAPQCAEAYYNLSLSKRFEAGDAAIGAMQELAQQAAFSDPRDAIKLNFALGKAFDDVGDYQQAFIYLSAGNEYKRRALPYDEPGVVGRLVRTRWTYTADFIRKRSGCGDTSEVPVFIVGMPRSGSTLVEQILSNHRAVHGAGEIDNFEAALAELGGAGERDLEPPRVRRAIFPHQFSQLGANYVKNLRAAAPAASRIINKTLENYRLAGLIAIALPRARIIHVQRDPIDTCFSCFSTLFFREYFLRLRPRRTR